ncbi:MAG: hypothetical protein HOO93_05500 [Methyloglobulus sp.]|uniref:hypothetical protein n=1 Tax=Methyloglobulus sp. TaxID=2518622 RepID=UPI0018583430|nr:hypothetical protein [Methyloglobulus sp.]
MLEHILPEKEITFSLVEVVEMLPFVQGVIYRDASRRGYGWIPRNTGDYLSCDCDEIDLKTNTLTGDFNPVWLSGLGEVVGYFGGKS